MDYVYESRFFIVNFLGIWGFWFVFTHITIFLVCLFGVFTGMFFVTGGLHRYFSHRTWRFVVPPWLEWIITTPKRAEYYLRGMQCAWAFLCTSVAQKGALWWAVLHRHHHKHSDTIEDIHSFDFKAKETGSLWKAFYWSHLGWVLDKEYKKVDYAKIPDLSKYPELMFFEKWYGYLIAPTLYGIICFFLGEWIDGGGWTMLLGGFFTRTFLTYHFTFCINSVAHICGWARYVTGEMSKNNPWLNFLTLGEGWHNNHHKNPFTAAQGITPEEQRSDITLQLLRLWQWTGMIEIIREYTPEEVEEARHLDMLRKAA